MVEKLTKEMFSENVNTKFRIQTGDAASIETELVEFKEFNMSPRQEQFSLLFLGPPDIFLQQNLYRVEHDKIGTFDLFLVPVRKDEGGLYYEAVFNRLIKEG